MFGNRFKGKPLRKRYFYGKTPTLENKNGFLKKRKSGISNIIPEPQKFKKIAILTFVVISSITLLYWMVFSGYFIIKEITIDRKEIQDENIFLKEYFSKYVGKNIIFTDINSSLSKAQMEHPEFKSLMAKKSYPSTIQISFSEYQSIANVTNVYKGGISMFIINEIGMATQKDTVNQNLPFIKIETENPLNSNTVLIQMEKIKYILNCVKFFEEKFNMKILEISYKMQEKELWLKTEKYFYIWLDIQKPYEEQLLKLKKSLSKLDIYNTPLEYIDLRIYTANGEKIIYKKRK